MLSSLWQIKDELQLLILAATIAVALWRGAGPERACAATYLAMWLGDRFYHLLVGKLEVLGGADLGHVIIDALTATSLVVVALNANRNYTLWLASMQLAALLSHFLRIISPAIDPTAYALLMASPMYLAVAIFAAGTVRHLRRRSRHGPYRSWRGFWNHKPEHYWPMSSPSS